MSGVGHGEDEPTMERPPTRTEPNMEARSWVIGPRGVPAPRTRDLLHAAGTTAAKLMGAHACPPALPRAHPLVCSGVCDDDGACRPGTGRARGVPANATPVHVFLLGTSSYFVAGSKPERTVKILTCVCIIVRWFYSKVKLKLQ